MAIIQETFEIPDDIAVGLATGLYRRIGGVVRYAVGERKGQIVTHLKPVVLPREGDVLPIAGKAMQFGRQHKKLMIGAFAVAGVTTLCGSIYAGITVHKRSVFQKAFKRYIDAIKTGNMSIEIIEDLELKLSDMKTVNMKTEELEILVDHIYTYTKRLAEINGIDIETKETNIPTTDLMQCLEVQKRIIKAA